MTTIKAPYPDAELYEQILHKGFETFPERKKNYEKYLESERTAIINYMPIKLDVEPTNKCNYKCSMCLHGSGDITRYPQMSFSDFKHLIDIQYGLVELKIQGVGEPFYNHNFIKMVEYARSKHLWVRTSTNASLLHIKENYKKIIDADISEIQISVDGTTKHSFEKIRKESNFEQVINNCKLINSYCHNQGVDRTRMWTVLQKDNEKDLYDFPELAADLGFKRLSLSIQVGEWGLDNWKRQNNVRQIEERNHDLSKVVALGVKYGVEVTFWEVSDKYNSANTCNLCPWPFNRAYISANMKIVPCCTVGNPYTVNFGEALDFESIWFGKTYQQKRQAHINGEIPKYCYNCYE